MSLTEETVAKYGSMVKAIAASYARTYPMVDKDDIYQEIWVWFATHPRKYQEWSELEDQKEADKLIAKSLRNHAYNFCIREKAVVSGYEYADNFWYKKEFIKTLLPAVLSEDWKRIEQDLDSGSRSSKAPSEAGDWMAYAADIRKAFQQLEQKERDLVYNFYAMDMDGNTLHEVLDSEKPTARATMMAANRALNKMVKKLGGFQPAYDPDEEDADDLRSMPRSRASQQDCE